MYIVLCWIFDDCFIKVKYYTNQGCAMAYWLRHATNRQVTGSIPDGVIGIFQWHNRSGRTMALGSTQPLTEMSTRCISWRKGSRCVRLTTLPPSCAVVMKSGNLNFLEPSGHSRPVTGLPYLFFYLTVSLKRKLQFTCFQLRILEGSMVKFSVPLCFSSTM
jgi:hypothetical protein